MIHPSPMNVALPAGWLDPGPGRPVADQLCQAGKLYAYRPAGPPPPWTVSGRRGRGRGRGRRPTLPTRYAHGVIELDSDPPEGQWAFHYFCLLFASHLDQNGIAPHSPDLGDDSIAQTHAGLFGFLITDIKREIERTRAITCQFCASSHANVACRAPGCWAYYHFTCGFEARAQFVFHDDFPSYCPQHRVDYLSLMEPPRATISPDKTCLCCYNRVVIPKKKVGVGKSSANTSGVGVVSPCCGRTFHWLCVQKMAMAGGSSLFKCPSCLDNQVFVISMRKCGIYVPLHDVNLNGKNQLSGPTSAKSADPNNQVHNNNNDNGMIAYDALPTVPQLHCDVPIRCRCQQGRNHNKKGTLWALIACQDCSIQAIHVKCGQLNRRKPEFTCDTCVDNRKAEERAQEIKLAEAARRKEALRGRKIGPKSRTVSKSQQSLGVRVSSTPTPTVVVDEPPLPKVTLSKQSGQWTSEVKAKRAKSPLTFALANQDQDPLDIGDFELVPTPSPRTSRSSRGVANRFRSPSPDILIVDPLAVTGVLDPLADDAPTKGQKRKPNGTDATSMPSKKARGQAQSPSSPDWAFPTPSSARRSRNNQSVKSRNTSVDSSPLTPTTGTTSIRARRSNSGLNKRWSPSPSESPPHVSSSATSRRGKTRSVSNSSSSSSARCQEVEVRRGMAFGDFGDDENQDEEEEPLAKKAKKSKKASPTKKLLSPDPLSDIAPISTRRSSSQAISTKTPKPGPKSRRTPPSPVLSTPPPPPPSRPSSPPARRGSAGGPQSRPKSMAPLTPTNALSPVVALPKINIPKPGPKCRKATPSTTTVVPPKSVAVKPGPKSRKIAPTTIAAVPAKAVVHKPGPKSRRSSANSSVTKDMVEPMRRAPPTKIGPKSRKTAVPTPKKANAGPIGRRKAKSPSPTLDDYSPSGGFDSPIGGASPVYSSGSDSPRPFLGRAVSPPPLRSSSKPGPASSKKPVIQPLESTIIIKQEFVSSPGPKSTFDDIFDQVRESTTRVRLPAKKRPRSPVRQETRAVPIRQEHKYRPGPKSTLEKRSMPQPERQSIRVLDKPLPRRQAVKRTWSEATGKNPPAAKKTRKGSAPLRIYQVKGKDIMGGIMSDLLILMEEQIAHCRTFSTQVATNWIHQDLLDSVFHESTEFCGDLLDDSVVDETLFRLFGPPYTFHLESQRASQYMAPLKRAQLTLSDCLQPNGIPPREALNAICGDILVDVANSAKKAIDDRFRWNLCSGVVRDLVEGVFQESAQFCATVINREVILETCFRLFGPPYRFSLSEPRAKQYLKPLQGSSLRLPDVMNAPKLPRLAGNTICMDILTDVAFKAKAEIDDRFRFNVCAHAVDHLVEDWLFRESSQFCLSILEKVVDEAGYRLFGPPKRLLLSHEKAPMILSKLQVSQLVVRDCIQQKCIPTEATQIFCDEILFDVIAQAETDILNRPVYGHRLVSEVLSDILRVMPMKSRRSIEAARMGLVRTRCRGIILTEVVDRAEEQILKTPSFPYRASYMILSDLVDSLGPAIITFRQEKERLRILEQRRLEAERRRPKPFSISLRDIYSLPVIPHPAVEFLCSGIMLEIVEQAEAVIVSGPRFVERMASYTLVRMVSEMTLPNNLVASKKRKRESSFSPSASKRTAVSNGPRARNEATASPLRQNGATGTSNRRRQATPANNGLLL
ncbi:hypothetical protein TCAL_09427 [Tigriopus californicus]|uniref:PHD-type domain-containing protein n=1 Tax=Tigriopus californicus TaxID=6832 RepID=A0A553PR14_TIGCA|nr:hypothetical protein TCAL_09427 [Tigriopus californicus]|eukprot:TCALIF_09427-PA protein Name:"Similar to G2E3 G2/M phase-specific E3 ubiquitin-protein ligase (Gallus gallus)" AED:0.15 eAED:0.15 QI:0/0.85/0.87/0.87/0.85/0.87/8/486/1671